MPIHSNKNRYPGINAHLHSFLQSEGGGWESFHAEYIVTIANILDKHLPPQYYSSVEKSLIEIFDDNPLTSVVIYEIEDGKIPGKAVTRIELLSPANKPGQGQHYRQYMAKRAQALRSGLFLVEIDYLHETRPIIPTLPSYIDHKKGAYPYLVLISNPHPKPEDGLIDIYGIRVDEPLPTYNIPLIDRETVPLDLSAAYNQTFENARMMQVIVDYELLPERFDTYTTEDQARIRERMKVIADESVSG